MDKYKVKILCNINLQIFIFKNLSTIYFFKHSRTLTVYYSEFFLEINGLLNCINTFSHPVTAYALLLYLHITPKELLYILSLLKYALNLILLLKDYYQTLIIFQVCYL